MSTRVCIAGRGNVGRALHRALMNSTQMETRLISGQARPRKSKEPIDLLILAIPDDAIAEAGVSLGQVLCPRAAVHCAGARTPEELAPLRQLGVHVGALHPLVSFADAKKPPSLVGTTFLIDGDPRATVAAKRVARAVGARPLVLAAHGAAYHAAAALVANGAAALADVGVDILVRDGWPQRDAERALGALLGTVGENVEQIGVPSALTGPVRRGDVSTVQSHRRALRKQSRRAYDAINRVIVQSARRAGLTKARARAIEKLTENHKG